MTFEYATLVFMTIFFVFAWIPSSLAKKKSYGLRWLVSNRTPMTGKELVPWGQRAERAHNNLKDNFPAFIVAIVLLGHLNKFDETTKYLAAIYAVSRVGHFVAYIAGVVSPRAFFYFSALIVNIILLVKIL